MTEHTSVSEHEHNHELENENIGLLDPSDCQRFLEVANEHGHDNEEEHEHEHEHNHGSGKVTWRLATMLFLTGSFFFVELITWVRQR